MIYHRRDETRREMQIQSQVPRDNMLYDYVQRFLENELDGVRRNPSLGIHVWALLVFAP